MMKDFRLGLVIGATVWLFFGIVFVIMTSCAKAPPNLTPAGATAWQNIQATKTLDLVRDLAVDGAHTGVISRAEALHVVDWHSAAIKILDARGAGWQQTIVTSLDQVMPQLSPQTRDKLAPYIALVKTVIAAL